MFSSTNEGTDIRSSTNEGTQDSVFSSTNEGTSTSFKIIIMFSSMTSFQILGHLPMKGLKDSVFSSTNEGTRFQILCSNEGIQLVCLIQPFCGGQLPSILTSR